MSDLLSREKLRPELLEYEQMVYLIYAGFVEKPSVDDLFSKYDPLFYSVLVEVSRKISERLEKAHEHP